LFWILSGWAFVIGVIVASVYPNALAAVNLTWGDKAIHAVTYFLMMIWFSGLYPRKHQGIVAVFVLALGFVLEMIQWRLPYRFFEPADLLANAAGVLAGLCLSVWLLAGWCQRLEGRLR
jgi:VanZ family protein